MDIHIKHFFIQAFLFACTFLPYISTKVHPDGLNYEECSPTKTTCEYWLVIQEKLTMIYEKNLVYAHKGKLYLYNEHHSNYTTRVSRFCYDIVRCYTKIRMPNTSIFPLRNGMKWMTTMLLFFFVLCFLTSHFCFLVKVVFKEL